MCSRTAEENVSPITAADLRSNIPFLNLMKTEKGLHCHVLVLFTWFRSHIFDECINQITANLEGYSGYRDYTPVLFLFAFVEVFGWKKAVLSLLHESILLITFMKRLQAYLLSVN
jgi:hypothetical protein